MSDAYGTAPVTSLVDVTTENLYALDVNDFMAEASIDQTIYGGELEDYDVDDMVDLLTRTVLSALEQEQGAKYLDIIPLMHFKPSWTIVEKPNESQYTMGNSLAYLHFGKKLTITLTIRCGGFSPNRFSSNEYHKEILQAPTVTLPKL